MSKLELLNNRTIFCSKGVMPVKLSIALLKEGVVNGKTIIYVSSKLTKNIFLNKINTKKFLRQKKVNNVLNERINQIHFFNKDNLNLKGIDYDYIIFDQYDIRYFYSIKEEIKNYIYFTGSDFLYRNRFFKYKNKKLKKDIFYLTLELDKEYISKKIRVEINKENEFINFKLKKF